MTNQVSCFEFFWIYRFDFFLMFIFLNKFKSTNFTLNPNASEFVPSFVMKQPMNKPTVYQEDIDPLELEARVTLLFNSEKAFSNFIIDFVFKFLSVKQSLKSYKTRTFAIT